MVPHIRGRSRAWLGLTIRGLSVYIALVITRQLYLSTFLHTGRLAKQREHPLGRRVTFLLLI